MCLASFASVLFSFEGAETISGPIALPVGEIRTISSVGRATDS